jgi:hypothetical protein
LVGSFPSGFVASHYFHCCITVSFFSGYCSFQDVCYRLVMSNYMPYP